MEGRAEGEEMGRTRRRVGAGSERRHVPRSGDWMLGKSEQTQSQAQ